MKLLQRGSATVLLHQWRNAAAAALSCLQTLAAGKYTLRVKSSSGEKAELPFEVRDKVRVELIEPVNGTL
jgi:hypothetical protein